MLLDENGFGNHGTAPSRAQESRKQNDDVDENDDQIAHLSIVARTGNARDWSENWQFAMDRSVLESSSFPSACSGDIQATVPTAVPGLVSESSAVLVVAVPWAGLS